tara:strand:- start:5839 stop:11043 length:5205 start_codon:yes stop_codon:yes gene_type:complete
MVKYLTPFDKAIAQGYNYLFNDEEEDKKKTIPELKSTVKKEDISGPVLRPDGTPELPGFDTQGQPLKVRTQAERDQEIIQDSMGEIFILPDGQASSPSDNPAILEKVKILNHPSRLMARRIEAEMDGTPMTGGLVKPPEIGPIEKAVLGDAPMTGTPTLERIGRKAIYQAGFAPRTVAAGLTRGVGGIMQLPQVMTAYGMGAVEQLLRSQGMYGEGTVDWDKLDSANTSAKLLSEEMEKLVKVSDDIFRVDDMSFMPKTAMFTVDFYTPMNFLAVPAKFLKTAADVTQDAYRMVRGLPKRPVPKDEIILQTLREMQTPIRSAKEATRQADLAKAFADAKKNNPQLELDDFELYSDFGKKIMEDRAKLFKKALKDINVDYGAKPNVVERVKERLKYPGGRQKAVLAADYRRDAAPKAEGGTFVPNPELEKVLITKLTPTYEELLNQKTFRKVMDGQAIFSAGALAAAWDEYFKGTEYQDFAYAAGFAGIFINPTTTMKVMDNIFGGRVNLQNWGVPKNLTKRLPFIKDMDIVKTVDNTNGQIVYRPLNLPFALHIMGKFLAEQTQDLDIPSVKVGPISTPAIQGGDPETFVDSRWNKKLIAMAQGTPWYKAMLLNDKDRIEALNGMTELDLNIRLSTEELRASQDFARNVIPLLPKEYLNSYTKLARHGEKLVNEINNSDYGDKTAEFYLTMEQIMQGIQMTAFTGILKHVTSDPQFKDLSKDVNAILLMFRTHQQELQDQIGYINSALKNLTGGNAQAEADFKKLKDGANRVITKLEQNRATVMEAAEGLEAKAGLVTKRDSLLTNQLIEESVENGGMGLSPERLSVEGREKFANDIDELFRSTFNADLKRDREEFAKLRESLEGRTLDIDDYVFNLRDMQKRELDDFGDVANILKNPGNFMAFARVSIKGPVDSSLSYRNSIDVFIRNARYRGLEADPDLTVKDLKDRIGYLKDSYSDLKFGGNNQYIKYNGIEEGLVDFDATLANAEDLAKKSTDGDGNPLTTKEYLMSFMSQLRSSQNGFDANFVHMADATDMHNLRVSHSQWAWDNRNRKPTASKATVNNMKNIDGLFDKQDIPGLAAYNKNHTNFKEKWFESFLQKKALKSGFYKPNENPAENDFMFTKVDFITDFLKAGDSKQAKQLLESLFENYTDAEGIDILRKDTKLKEFQKLADSFLFDGMVYGNIFDGLNENLLKRKLDDLVAGGLISKSAREKVIAFQTMTGKTTEGFLAKEFESINAKVVDKLSRAVKAKQGEERSSIVQDLAGINTASDLLDYFVPNKGTPTWARGSELTQDVNVDRLQELVEKQAELIETSKNAGPEFKKAAQLELNDITKELENYKQVNIENISGNRFEVYLNGILKVKKTDRAKDIDKETKADLAALRDSLVSEMIRASINKTSARKAYLNPSTDGGFFSKTLDAVPRYLQNQLTREGTFSVPSSAFELDFDFNLVNLGETYDALKPALLRIDELTNDKPEFVKDLDNLFKGLVALKGEVPDELATGDFGNIPTALSTSAALSRIYSGVRGVVSWRYLATEQIVREHQRSKHMMFHKMLTDPKFLENVKLIMDSDKITEKLADTFVKSFLPIMKTAGARTVIYNPVEGEEGTGAKYNPSNKELVEAIKKMWLVPDILEDVRGILPQPKPLATGDIEVKFDPPKSLKDIARSPVRFRRGLEKNDADRLKTMPRLNRKRTTSNVSKERERAMRLLETMPRLNRRPLVVDIPGPKTGEKK